MRGGDTVYVRRRRERRGFMFADAVVALGLLGAVAMLLVAGRSAAARVARASEDRRAAVRLAEAYLSGARPAAETPTTQPARSATPSTGPTTDAAPAAPVVTVTPLPTTAPAGWQWVSVHSTVNGHAGELVGLVRRKP